MCRQCSDYHVEIVREVALENPIEKMAAVYAAYSKGDPEPFYDLIADDAVIRFAAPPGSFKFARTYNGPGGAREAITAIVSEFQWLTYSNSELIADGKLVVGINGGRILHLVSGREAALCLGDFVRFDNGKIVEFVEFFDSAGFADWCSGNATPACAMMNPANKLGALSSENPEENKAVLRQVYDAYAELNADPMISALAEDVTYNSVARGSDFAFAGPYYGRDAFVENLKRIADEYQLRRYKVLDMIADGDLVAVHADVAFEERDTGRLAETEKLDVFRMFNGQITEFNEFLDSLQSRRAGS